MAHATKCQTRTKSYITLVADLRDLTISKIDQLFIGKTNYHPRHLKSLYQMQSPNSQETKISLDNSVTLWQKTPSTPSGSTITLHLKWLSLVGILSLSNCRGSTLQNKGRAQTILEEKGDGKKRWYLDNEIYSALTKYKSFLSIYFHQNQTCYLTLTSFIYFNYFGMLLY